jgi:hypothetical protein
MSSRQNKNDFSNPFLKNFIIKLYRYLTSRWRIPFLVLSKFFDLRYAKYKLLASDDWSEEEKKLLKQISENSEKSPIC